MQTCMLALGAGALLLCSVPAQAQSVFLHPDEPGALLLDTLHCSALIERADTTHLLEPRTSKCRIAYVIGTFRTCTGRIDCVLDATTVTCLEDDQCCDSVETAELLDTLAVVAVEAIIDSGLCPCGPVETGVRFYTAACVERTGSGLLTHFHPCQPECSFRELRAVCDESGLRSIAVVPRYGSSCLPPCQSTLPQQPGERSLW